MLAKTAARATRFASAAASRRECLGAGCLHRGRGRRRRYSSTTVAPFDGVEPFYGKPRPPTGGSIGAGSIADKIALAVTNAGTALSDPTRADAVAALGEVTGSLTLERIRARMESDPIGREILRDRPVVSKAAIPFDDFIASAPERPEDADPNAITFGQAYGVFLKRHDFDPDDRDEVRYVDDETLAYVMLRYRQNHDFFHVLTGLPPTVLGELGLKWLELFQTGLPIAALSCAMGPLRLDGSERAILFDSYLPWACEQHRRQRQQELEGSGPSPSLMNVYYEKEFDTPLKDLRKRLNLVPAPSVPE